MNDELDSVTMVDLRDVEEQEDFPVIPKGIYPAIVDELTFGYSQNSGNPMWTWRLEISEGEYSGRKLFFHTPFVENMLPRLKRILSRVAPKLLEDAFDPEAVASSGDLIGTPCRVRVDIRPYEGQNRNNVRDLLPPAEGTADSFL